MKITRVEFDPVCRWIWIYRGRRARQYRMTTGRVCKLWPKLDGWRWSQEGRCSFMDRPALVPADLDSWLAAPVKVIGGAP